MNHMRITAIRAAVLATVIAFAPQARSKECKVQFIRNANGIGDPPTRKIPGVVARAGEVRSGATQYTVFKPSGITAVCFRGGYCYSPASAVKLENCKIDQSRKEEDSYSTIYYLQ